MLRSWVNMVGAALIVLLVLGAWECTAAPKAQCHDGAQKVHSQNGKSTHYTCHNGEWVKGR